MHRFTVSPARDWVLGTAACATTFYLFLTLSQSFSMFAWDFAVNWTAANAIRVGLPLYDATALSGLVQGLIDPTTSPSDWLFTDPLNSYTSPPWTAALLLPFTLWAFPVSTQIYRLTLVSGFGAAVFVAGLAVPRTERWLAWLVGLFSLAVLPAAAESVRLGQVDAFITLALSIAVWGVARNRWGTAGAGVACAALLKVSPGLAVGWFLLRRKWRAVIAASLLATVVLGYGYAVAGPDNLVYWLTRELPVLSDGTAHVQNQSLPALLDRVFRPGDDILDFRTGLGPLRWIGLLVGLVTLALLWKPSRSQPAHPLEAGMAILGALLMGPIAWTHYSSWAIVPLVLMVDRGLWTSAGRRLRLFLVASLVAGWLLLVIPQSFALGQVLQTDLLYKMAGALQAGRYELLRLSTGPNTVGLSLWFAVSAILLLQRKQQSQVEFSDPTVVVQSLTKLVDTQPGRQLYHRSPVLSRPTRS